MLKYIQLNHAGMFACGSPHSLTCSDLSSGTAPASTAGANRAHSQTSSGNGTQVTGRQPPSHSWMSHTPQGKTWGGPSRSSRLLHTTFLMAGGSECSAPPRADLRGHQTAAVWGWWAECHFGCDGWTPLVGSHGTVQFHTAEERERQKWMKKKKGWPCISRRWWHEMFSDSLSDEMS